MSAALERALAEALQPVLEPLLRAIVREELARREAPSAPRWLTVPQFVAAHPEWGSTHLKRLVAARVANGLRAAGVVCEVPGTRTVRVDEARLLAYLVGQEGVAPSPPAPVTRLPRRRAVRA